MSFFFEGILAVFYSNVVSNSVYNWITIILIPLNSSINPYIYSMSEIVKFVKLKENLYKTKKYTEIYLNYSNFYFKISIQKTRITRLQTFL